jgi:hypothetical protein
MSNRDEINEYLRRIEMYMPPAWTLKFGEWDTFKQKIDDLMTDSDENEDEVQDMKRDIDDVLDTLQDAQDNDPDNAAIGKAIDKLRTLV